jgi:hypothetical protein
MAKHLMLGTILVALSVYELFFDSAYATLSSLCSGILSWFPLPICDLIAFSHIILWAALILGLFLLYKGLVQPRQKPLYYPRRAR